MEKSIVVSSKEANIGSVLFQIHALAKILEKRMIDEEDEKESISPSEYSNKSLSLVEILVEKIEFCLDAIDKNGEQPSEYGNLNAK